MEKAISERAREWTEELNAIGDLEEARRLIYILRMGEEVARANKEGMHDWLEGQVETFRCVGFYPVKVQEKEYSNDYILGHVKGYLRCLMQVQDKLCQFELWYQEPPQSDDDNPF